MTKEKIINYAMSTPHNTNEAVLGAIIDQHNKEILDNAGFVKTVNGQGPDEQGNVEVDGLGGGGGGDMPMFVTITTDDDETYTANQTFTEVLDAIKNNRQIFWSVIHLTEPFIHEFVRYTYVFEADGITEIQVYATNTSNNEHMLAFSESGITAPPAPEG